MILRLFANTIVFCRRILRRVQMALLRPAFRTHGRKFLFDPKGEYTYRNISVGDYVSIGTNAVFLATRSKIIIGSKVMFGPNVTIIGGNHNTAVVGKYMYDVDEKHPDDDQDVVIEDDVWVGAGATILKGVCLHRGCIVAAGALVNRDVEPYAIVAGVPAKLVGVRFDQESIAKHEQILGLGPNPNQQHN